ncbi:hypothetical protein [Pelagicoccus sp. SDUM812003]|uniref:hypothetical protein n=1 Tax=Pelagicoccus sp. SDUM812003 TaxID=3041267 RepID=UPI00280DAE6A|nr:hypothetical protein [Pelagicoccus sp. SDUM812003]MDQ8205752.1 hypothetical protein [Pelagicoccus sp. SDUM812003]
MKSILLVFLLIGSACYASDFDGTYKPVYDFPLEDLPPSAIQTLDQEIIIENNELKMVIGDRTETFAIEIHDRFILSKKEVEGKVKYFTFYVSEEDELWFGGFSFKKEKK